MAEFEGSGLGVDSYTKIWLDQHGNILKAEQLEEIDLPEHKHHLDDLDGDFKKKVIESLKQFFANDMNNAVVFNFDEKTQTVSADIRYDRFTIDKNEDGEIQFMGGMGDGEGTGGINSECATHTHLARDVEDFEEAVKKILGDLNGNLSANDLKNIIDNTTIIINENGTLSSVGGMVKEHQHYLKDIVDYEAPLPAALQPMNDLGENVDYSDGPIDLKDLSIGYAIVSLNYYLEHVINRKLLNLQNQINRLAQTASNANAMASLKPSANLLSNKLLDRKTNTIRDVFYGPDFSLTLEALPYDNAEIIVMVDNEEVSSTQASDLLYGAPAINNISVERMIVKGETSDKVLNFKFPNLSEGLHTIQIKYGLDEGVYDYSQQLDVAITNRKEMEFEVKDLNPTHILNGQVFYDEPFDGLWKIAIKDFDDLRFVNLDSGFNKYGVMEISNLNVNTMDDSRVIQNLFGTTNVSINFPYSVECSESELYKNAKEIEGEVVNDVVIPKGIKATITSNLPRSRSFNSVEIFGIDKEFVKIIKGDTIADSKTESNPFTGPGFIPTDNDSLILSIVDGYDNGKDDLLLYIESYSPINLKKISYRLFNM